jgi:hypothetical protein
MENTLTAGDRSATRGPGKLEMQMPDATSVVLPASCVALQPISRSLVRGEYLQECSPEPTHFHPRLLTYHAVDQHHDTTAARVLGK